MAITLVYRTLDFFVMETSTSRGWVVCPGVWVGMYCGDIVQSSSGVKLRGGSTVVSLCSVSAFI